MKKKMPLTSPSLWVRGVAALAVLVLIICLADWSCISEEEAAFFFLLLSLQWPVTGCVYRTLAVVAAASYRWKKGGCLCLCLTHECCLYGRGISVLRSPFIVLNGPSPDIVSQIV
uniref:Uncharacterized protein n=1 Tax=Anopheles darlingi TaxID=43151 RepID=A0A2M4DB03_ANODA